MDGGREGGIKGQVKEGWGYRIEKDFFRGFWMDGWMDRQPKQGWLYRIEKKILKCFRWMAGQPEHGWSYRIEKKNYFVLFRWLNK